MSSATENLMEAISQAAGQYHRLVVFVGPSGSGKTTILRSLAKEKGYPYVNVNLQLSQKMLELTRAQRTRQAGKIFKDILAATTAEVRILDNVEVLFDCGLQLEVLRLLQSCSRNHITVVSWNGNYRDGTLTYAEPGHPEFVQFKQAEAIFVTPDQQTVT